MVEHRNRKRRLLVIPAVLVMVALLTGGPDTFPFWIGVWVQYLGLTVHAALSVAMIGGLIIWPVAWLIGELTDIPDERIAIPIGLVAIIWVSLRNWVNHASVDATGISLPFGSTYLGLGVTLLLIVVAQIAAYLAFPVVAWVKDWEESRPPPVQLAETPVIGWRWWVWTGQVLHGTRRPWHTEVMEADCAACREAPGWFDQCGINAYRAMPYDDRVDPNLVLGKVEMWGDVVEHEDGYRSSHARIIELYARDESVFIDLTVRYPAAVVMLTEDGGGR